MKRQSNKKVNKKNPSLRLPCYKFTVSILIWSCGLRSLCCCISSTVSTPRAEQGAVGQREGGSLAISPYSGGAENYN